MMNIFRKVIGVLLAVSWLVFMQSAIAAKPPQAIAKKYSLQFVIPDTVTVVGEGEIDNPVYEGGQLVPTKTRVTVYIKNESPPSTASSNIGSFQFTVSAGLLVAGVSCPRGECTVVANTVTGLNISPPIQGMEVFPVQLEVNSCVAAGEVSIVPNSILVRTGTQLTGTDFVASTASVLTLSNTSLEEAGISCGNTATCETVVSVPNSACPAEFADDPTCVTKIRGLDKDGDCRVLSEYFVTNNLDNSNDKHLHFKWNTDVGAFAAFAYKVTAAPLAPNTEPVWAVSSADSPDYTDAVNCEPGAIEFGEVKVDLPPPSYFTNLPLPIPYGTLGQSVSKTKNKIQLVGTSPAVGSVIVIGTERMRVTDVSSNNNLTVERHDGQPANAAAEHEAGAAIMSTPLPKLTATTHAQMCLASSSNPNGDGTWSVWVIDIGDGWVTPNR